MNKTKGQSFLSALTRRKPFAEVADPEHGDKVLRRVLGYTDLTLLGISSTLGAGVYILTGTVARDVAGPAIVVSLLIGALTSVFSGLCYCEFGARVPRAGSAYLYTYITVGEFVSFLIGWNLLLDYIIGSASVARALTGYIDNVMGGWMKGLVGDLKVEGIGVDVDVWAFVVCIALTVFCLIGIKVSAKINLVCTLINVAGIVLMVIVGSFYAKPRNWDEFAPFGLKGIIEGAASCFYAFVGFDVITSASEETIHPGRMVPLSILMTIGFCFLAYESSAVVLTMMVPYSSLMGDAPFASAFSLNNAVYMNYIISVAAIFGLLGCLTVSLLPLPRVLYSMAKDGLIFSAFAKTAGSTDVPYVGTIVGGLLTAIFAMLLELMALVEMLSIGVLLAYTIVAISVILLRYSPSQVELNSEKTQSVPQTDLSKGDISVLPTEWSYTCVKFALTAAVILMLLLGVLTVMALSMERVHWTFLSSIAVLSVSVVVCFFSIAICPTNREPLDFKVPLVPWIPGISMFINIFLMLLLRPATWIRFSVWITVGLIVYFCYGFRYSKLRHNDDYKELREDNASHDGLR